jgi:hypothetical protein
MKKKYFTEEEKREAHRKSEEKRRRLMGILPRIKQTKEERKESRKRHQRKYKKTHPNYNREYEYNRYKNDINFKLRKRLRNRLRDALNDGYKSGSAVQDLGCSIPELKNYLESKFQEGMTWENWSFKGWHIDHIIPLDSFNLSDRKEFLKACHYTNLQPLWSSDNIRKKNKFYINSNEGE